VPLGRNGGEIAAGLQPVRATRRTPPWQPAVIAIHVLQRVETAMLALRLPAEIEKRLDTLARKTGRSKSFYAREAILRHLEDLEDYHLARRRLARKAKRVSLEDLERELAETG
jgi:RHH-type rel operon transcriptional repressor/antitoxin RelB